MVCSLSIHESVHPLQVEPADLVVCRPQLRCLVDINVAGLLGIRLAEFFPNARTLQPALEKPALAGNVSSTVQSQVASQHQFVGVKQMSVWVIAEVNWLAPPIGLHEARGTTGQAAGWRTVIGNRLKVLVLAHSASPTGGFWSGASSLGGSLLGWGHARGAADAISGSSVVTLGLGDTIGSLNARGGFRSSNGSSRHNGLVAMGSSFAVSDQKLSLLAQPSLGVDSELLHDLGLEVQGIEVILTLGWLHYAKGAGRPSSEMVVDNALVQVQIDRDKQRRL